MVSILICHSFTRTTPEYYFLKQFFKLLSYMFICTSSRFCNKNLWTQRQTNTLPFGFFSQNLNHTRKTEHYYLNRTVPVSKANLAIATVYPPASGQSYLPTEICPKLDHSWYGVRDTHREFVRHRGVSLDQSYVAAINAGQW